MSHVYFFKQIIYAWKVKKLKLGFKIKRLTDSTKQPPNYVLKHNISLGECSFDGCSSKVTEPQPQQIWLYSSICSHINVLAQPTSAFHRTALAILETAGTDVANFTLRSLSLCHLVYLRQCSSSIMLDLSPNCATMKNNPLFLALYFKQKLKF